MTRNRLFSVLAIASLALSACASGDEDANPEFDELADGLALDGKADAVTGVEVLGYGIALRKAAARTLYNLLDVNDAQSALGNGTRALYANGIGCITNGTATYCIIGGASESGNATYEGIVHGSNSFSGARTLHGLIADGSTDSFVETPWFACERSGNSAWCGVEASATLTLGFDGLEDLGSEFVYEGWTVSDGVATTTGRFQGGGTLQQQVPASIADDSLYILTIEPKRGDDPAPAATHLMAGALTLNQSSTIGIEHQAALGTDFASASGSLILATPTSTTMDDESQGIWFVDPGAGAPSLDLPTLPAGWAYEGWVVGADGPVSTGRFTSLSGADSDGGGPSAGPEMSPPFPGQDFVSPAMDLIGATVVISVEPEPDDSAKPFAIKPLILGAVGDVLAPMLQDLGNTSENRPSATALLEL